MGKKSEAPNVKGAARTEAESSEEIARSTTYADRPDQYNPWGSLTWSTQEVLDPASGEYVTKWIQNQQLSPEAQALYDMQLQGMTGRQEAAQGLLNRAYGEYAQPLDWDQFGQAERFDFDPTQLRQRAEDAAYQRETMRLDPQFETQRKALELRLSQQGLSPGDRAYDAAMMNFQQGMNDAYERARLGATSTGLTEAQNMWNMAVQGNEISNALRQQDIQEYLGKRGYSLGEAEALSQGADFAALTSAVGQGG